MKKKPMAVSALLAACAVTAVAVPIAQGTKAHSASSHQGAVPSVRGVPGPGGGPGGPGGPPGPPAVHSVSVVLNKARSGFVTQTTDSGTIEGVDASGGTITLDEGTKTLKYQTVTVTVPGGATVLLDGKTSSLSDLATGDRVTVVSSSEGTTVMAGDSSFHPEGSPGHGGPPGGAPPSGTE